MPTDTISDILARVEKNRIRFIDLQFTDVVGVVKNVTIPSHELPAALENGIWFDGSSIEGFARIAESDMHLRPDPSTFIIIPWLSGEDATARLICDVYTPEGEPFPGDPRGALRRALAAAEEMGFRFNTGPELEFFLLNPHADGSLIPPQVHDVASYFDAPSDKAAGLRRQMTNTLEALGLDVEALHHEGAPGQHEIDFRYSDALSTADSAVTLRVAARHLQRRRGNIGGYDVDVGGVVRNRNRDRARAGAKVQHAGARLAAHGMQSCFDHQFGFGARDKYVAIHLEFEAVKFLAAHNVRQRFPDCATADELPEAANALVVQRQRSCQHRASIGAGGGREQQLRVQSRIFHRRSP